MGAMGMKKPSLVIETSPAGVETVTIRVPRGGREGGLALLQRVLPALRDLNQRVQGPLTSLRRDGERVLIRPKTIDRLAQQPGRSPQGKTKP